ncbi:MAG: hypothetical protein DRP51_02345, partial [Candidatus Zixiibacteriota bacterium]
MLGRISATFFCGLLIFSSAGFPQGNKEPVILPSDEIFVDNLAITPLIFTENKGQWDSRVLFRARARGGTMWFTPGGVNYQFVREVAGIIKEDGANINTEQIDQEQNIECLMIRASFDGANPIPVVSGDNLLNYKCHYFLDNNPGNWQTDVRNFEGLIYQDIYPGIDLKYYGKGRQIEYDFLVSPEADISQIRIHYEGIKALYVNAAGELEVETDWGKVTELKPVVYQGEGTTRKKISAQYRIVSPNTFGFELGDDYDPARPAVIDPVIVYSTYLGGGVDDYVGDIVIDDSGYATLVGYTYSSDFPTVNGYDNDFNGWCDIF